LARKAETFPPVTMGHIRSHGCRGLGRLQRLRRCGHRLNDYPPSGTEMLPILPHIALKHAYTAFWNSCRNQPFFML
jgi:hypothetical protein